MRKLRVLFLALIVTVVPIFATPASHCLTDWARNPRRYHGFYRPSVGDADSPNPISVRILSDEQDSVDEWDKIEAIKRDMLAGTFDYVSGRGVVAGYYDERANIFYVSEGHHRFAAALEIAKETGNWSPFKKLVKWGLWDFTDHPPQKVAPLPVRSTLWNYFAWRRFLRPLRP